MEKNLKGMDICIGTTELFCCTRKTNTVNQLYSNIKYKFNFKK